VTCSAGDLEVALSTGSECDVAIVGAGIAGSAAAIFFGRAGARVALIERAADPAAYKKACTHCIQASATPTIARLGLASAIDAAGGVHNNLEVYTRYGWIAAPPKQTISRPAFGYNVRRSTLDPMVRKTAMETPGVEYIPGFSAHELRVVRGRITGVTIRGEGGILRDIGAKLVVGADGRQSRIAHLAQLPTTEKPNGRFCYFAHYRNLPRTGDTRSLIWMLEPDVAYALPNDDDTTIVAAMPARAKLPQWKIDPEGAMRRLFETLPRAPSLADAQRASPFMGYVDYPNWSRTLTKPGLALIGDAALSLDPVAGIGCGWAFQSAEWLADAVSASWKSPDELDRGLAAYAKIHRSRLSGHKFFIEDYSTARSFSAIERLLFSAATRDPVCADNLHALLSRCVGVGQSLRPSAIMRAIWVNARHRLGAGQTIPSRL
jgi:flavin-dependent dehydrogenase